MAEITEKLDPVLSLDDLRKIPINILRHFLPLVPGLETEELISNVRTIYSTFYWRRHKAGLEKPSGIDTVIVSFVQKINNGRSLAKKFDKLCAGGMTGADEGCQCISLFLVNATSKLDKLPGGIGQENVPSACVLSELIQALFNPLHLLWTERNSMGNGEGVT